MVLCPICPCVIWFNNKEQVELRCTVSFKDKGLPYIEEHLGIIVGFGHFRHTCRPDLEPT
jgi:hypothetical protein